MAVSSVAAAGLRAGIDLLTIPRRLGHSSVAIAGDLYSNVSRSCARLPPTDGRRAHRPEGVAEWASLRLMLRTCTLPESVTPFVELQMQLHIGK